MIGLAEKGLAELEALAADFRRQIALDPQHSRGELGDIEWEMEKRRWRKEPEPSANGHSLAGCSPAEPASASPADLVLQQESPLVKENAANG